VRLRLRRTSRFERDVAELVLSIGEDNPAAAIKFLDALESLFDRLQEMPHLGKQVVHLPVKTPNLRMIPVPGFPKHLLFYRVLPHEIELLDVLHGARDIEDLL
jgi:toxin ParE1/3/4